MRSAGFPCFKSDSIKKLRERFCVGMSPKDVVAKVDELKRVIQTTYERLDNALTTYHQDQGSE